MNCSNEINKIYAPLPLAERKKAKEKVMNMLELESDKAFHAQRNGKSKLSLVAALVWARVLEKKVEDLFVLKT